MKLLPGPGLGLLEAQPALLYRSNHWFGVKHKLQGLTDGTERSGVSQPKPFVYFHLHAALVLPEVQTELVDVALKAHNSSSIFLTNPVCKINLN